MAFAGAVFAGLRVPCHTLKGVAFTQSHAAAFRLRSCAFRLCFLQQMSRETALILHRPLLIQHRLDRGHCRSRLSQGGAVHQGDAGHDEDQASDGRRADAFVQDGPAQ
jgi:hypothetical protein